MKGIEMYAKIQELKELGMSQNAVAAQLGMPGTLSTRTNLKLFGRDAAFMCIFVVRQIRKVKARSKMSSAT